MFVDITHKQGNIFMSTNIENEIKNLLNKFRSETIPPEDFKKLKSGINQLSDSDLKNSFEEEWEIFDDYKPLPQDKIQALYQKLDKKAHISPIIKVKKYWLQIAASILLIMACGLTALYYMQNKDMKELAEQNIVINSGEYGNSLVTLPDGSLVHLNAKSSLTYRQDFGHKDRKVSLSGEGYFEVKKNTEKHFIVATDVMDITVTGTKFNVYAYENKDFVEMALVEGSVNVTTKGSTHNTLSVKPNQKVTYNKLTGQLSLEETSNKVETAWLTKELSFRHEKMKDVFRCLERKFGVVFEISNQNILQDAYTGTFNDENIESILRILKMHYGFEYSINEEIITIE